MSSAALERSAPDHAHRSGRHSDRAVGRLMIAVAVVCAIVGGAGAVIAASLVSSLRGSVDDSLVLTSDTLDTAADSIALSSSIVATLRVSVDSVSAALTAVQTSIDDTATALTDVGTFASGPLADSLDAVNTVLPTLETTAAAVDDALTVLSKLPFGPDYAPDQSLDETVGGLTDALAPLPEQLRALDTDFADLGTSATDVSDRLTAVIADVDSLTVRLDGIDVLLTRYATTATDAQDIARSSRADLDRNARLTVVLAVLIGLLVIASQIVPLWLGRRLVRGEPTGVRSIDDPAGEPVWEPRAPARADAWQARLDAPVGGYTAVMDQTHGDQHPSDHTTGAPPRDGRAGDVDAVEEVLEAFNAGEVVERPGEPPVGPDSPADDSDVPAPG